MRAQQLRRFAVLKSQEWLSGAVHNHQDATIMLIRGVGVPRMWNESASSTGCLPTKHFPRWK
eukprot:3076169-Pyramimonas_sp.AAC.1